MTGTTTSITGITGQDDLVIVVAGASGTSASRTINAYFNTDTGSNYQAAGGFYEKTDTLSQFSAAATAITLFRMANDVASLGSATLEVSGANSSTGFKKFMMVSGVDNSQAGGRTFKSGGIYQSTSPITSVQIELNGTFDAGTVFIYGSA